VVKPLTARYHFSRLFLDDKWKTMLMSATVGDFKTFCGELGVPMSKCMTRRVPSNFPPETRPIHVLDAPKLNWKSKEEDYERQAEVIAEAIKECPPGWSGLVHVTRISEGPKLAERLVRQGIDPDRIWTRPTSTRRWLGTHELVEDWEQFLARRSNAIAISCIMHQGYDGITALQGAMRKLECDTTALSTTSKRLGYSSSSRDGIVVAASRTMTRQRKWQSTTPAPMEPSWSQGF
jgi:hypothetical protein